MTIDEEAFSKAVMAAAPLGFVSTTQMRRAVQAYEQAKKGESSTSNDEAQTYKVGASAPIVVSPAQLGDACKIGSPANTALVQKLVDTLESVWYSEFGNSETCLEGKQIKEALTEAQAWLEEQEARKE